MLPSFAVFIVISSQRDWQWILGLFGRVVDWNFLEYLPHYNSCGVSDTPRLADFRFRLQTVIRAIVLEHLAALHHKINAQQLLDVFQWRAIGGDYVSVFAGFYGAEFPL